MKRAAFFFVFALALVAPGWAALGPRYGGDLTVAVVAPLPNPEATTSDSAVGRLLASLTRESLVGVGPDGALSAGLARGWASAAGGREWILVLDEEARFHDDRPVTADDVVRSLRAFLGCASPAARRLGASLAPDGLLAPDAGHVALRFREPLAMPLAPLAAAAITGASGAQAGPFIPTHAVPGRRIALTTFASHVRGRPYLDRIAVVASGDEERLRAALATREVDVALGAPGISSLAGTLLLVLDPRQAPFAKLEARSALASAIDVGAIVKRFLPGGVATRSLLPLAFTTPTTAQPAPVSPYPLAAPLVLAVSSEVPPLASQRIIAHLDALGLRVTLRVLDAAAARRSDAAIRLLIYVPEVLEAALVLRELAALAPPVPAAEAALAEGDGELDPARRRAALERAAAALLAAKALLPLATVPLSAGARPGIEGVRVDAAGRVLLEDAWLSP